MGESIAMRVRATLGGRNVVLVVALALSFTSTWLINTAVYPLTDPFAPQAQYAAPLVGALVAFALALVCQHKPRLFASRRAMLGTLVVAECMSALMYASALLVCAPLAVLAATVRWVACIFRDVVLGFALMGLTAPACVGVLVGGYALRYLFGLLLSLAPLESQIVCFFLCFPAGLLLLWGFARPSFERLEQVGTPADLSITNPLSFLPLTSRMFVAVVLFHAALGFSVTFGGALAGPVAGPLLVLVFFALLLACALGRGLRSVDRLYGAAYLFALAGMLLVPALSMGEGVLAGLCSVFCEAGSSLFSLAMWYLVARIGARSLAGALPVLCMVRAARGFGIALGLGSGALATWLGTQDGLLIALLAAGMAFCFAAYNFLFARSFSFDATVRSVRPLEGVRVLAEAPGRVGGSLDRRDAAGPAETAATPAASGPEGPVGQAGAQGRQPDGAGRLLDEACSRLVRDCRLTARESDVLRLLARGRNAAYIQQELHLTRSTVKSYVADVYRKLDVHSHQELIDLVEQG